MELTMEDISDNLITSKRGTHFYISDYNNSDQVTVTFLDGYKTTTSMGNIRKGLVRNPYELTYKNVASVGSKYKPTKNREVYNKWTSMINRSMGEGRQSYVEDVTVCEEWYCFENFADWYYENKPDTDIPLDLDKDIIYIGNKHYSPEYCSIVPRQLNRAFTKRSRNSVPELLPSGNYRVQGSIGGVYYDYNVKSECEANELHLLKRLERYKYYLRTYFGILSAKVIDKLVQEIRYTELQISIFDIKEEFIFEF